MWTDAPLEGGSGEKLPLLNLVLSEVEFWPVVLVLALLHSLSALTDDNVDESFVICLDFLFFFASSSLLKALGRQRRRILW